MFARMAVTIAGFVLLFMLVSQIGLVELYSLRFYLLVALSFSAVSVVMPTIVAFLQHQLSQKVKLDRRLWQEVSALVVIFSLVAVGNLLMAKALFSVSVNALFVIAVWLVTVIVGSIPLSITLFYRQKKELEGKLSLVSSIQRNPTPAPKPNALVCAESDGNYLKLPHRNGEVEKIRATMKHWLENDGIQAGLIRVHSGFAVSLPHVVSARGNVQGFFLQLAYPLPEVPVSRRYIPVVRELMTNIPQR